MADHKIATASQDWTALFVDYLVRGNLPNDTIEARRLARRCKSFMVVGETLYKRSTLGILQRCIPRDQGQWLLREIHTGICGHHAVPKLLANKAFWQGFYWLTAIEDA